MAAGACLPPPGEVCGTDWCPHGYSCAPDLHSCFQNGHNGQTVDADAYIKASNASAADNFGRSVALSGDGATLAVGASGESSAASGVGGDQDSNSAPNAGAVYVFTHSDTGWSQQAFLKPSNTGALDAFGYKVALSADGATLAVGAYGESSAATGVGGDQYDNSAPNAGAVYVFTRRGTTWTQQAFLKASNTDARDTFGHSVALSGDGATLAVGAVGESSAATGIGGDQADNAAPGAGAAYVFTRSGTTWTQEVFLKASNADARDFFGDSVALSGNGATLAVGAFFESGAATGVGGDQTDNSAPNAGAVYVFTRSGATWTQEAYLKASSTDANLFFCRVALSGDGATLAVGAYGESSAAIGGGDDPTDNFAPNAGAVYVFARSGATWTQDAFLQASNANAMDVFGARVALSADGATLAVSAIGESSAVTGIGGDQADNSAARAGAVYVFRRSGTTWIQGEYVKASNTHAMDQFGDSVALSADGSTVAIGAMDESGGARGIDGDLRDTSALAAGAVYVYGTRTP